MNVKMFCAWSLFMILVCSSGQQIMLSADPQWPPQYCTIHFWTSQSWASFFSLCSECFLNKVSIVLNGSGKLRAGLSFHLKFICCPAPFALCMPQVWMVSHCGMAYQSLQTACRKCVFQHRAHGYTLLCSLIHFGSREPKKTQKVQVIENAFFYCVTAPIRPKKVLSASLVALDHLLCTVRLNFS